MFVKTSRRFDPHDKLVREYYMLEPHINGMAKNGLRNLRHEVSTTIVQVLLHRGRAGFRGSHGAQGTRPPTKRGPPTKPFNFYFAPGLPPVKSGPAERG